MSGNDTAWWAVKPGRYVHGPASPILRLLMNSNVNEICVNRHTIPISVANGDSGEYSNIIRSRSSAYGVFAGAGGDIRKNEVK